MVSLLLPIYYTLTQMDDLAFAFGITFPGTTSTDVVKAALQHSVHIVDKELFDPHRHYGNIYDQLHPDGDTVIYPLFIFPESSILVNSKETYIEAIELSKAYTTAEL